MLEHLILTILTGPFQGKQRVAGRLPIGDVEVHKSLEGLRHRPIVRLTRALETLLAPAVRVESDVLVFLPVGLPLGFLLAGGLFGHRSMGTCAIGRTLVRSVWVIDIGESAHVDLVDCCWLTDLEKRSLEKRFPGVAQMQPGGANPHFYPSCVRPAARAAVSRDSESLRWQQIGLLQDAR